MPKWDVSPQGSAGWLKSRCGCLTASRMADAMAFNKKGEPLESRKKYMVELLAERMTDTMVERYVTPAMQWGTQTEPEARGKYEEVSGNLVQECGFALHDTLE
ncbi:MAG: YqaJ viral recombinase family protein, partial [Plesiomonas shigelloides]